MSRGSVAISRSLIRCMGTAAGGYRSLSLSILGMKTSKLPSRLPLVYPRLGATTRKLVDRGGFLSRTTASSLGLY